MTFLNPLLLIAALGVGLPILAHLLNRFQVRHTDWAAMRFLNRSVRVRSRQIKLRDLFLLILRCLALLLLVFALARPAWTGGSWLPGERRAGVVIAIDASFSMDHGPDGKTRFAEALKRVDVIRAKMTPGDPVTLVLLGGAPRVVVRNMAYDDGRFAEALQGLEAGPGTMNPGGIPEFLADLVADMEAPHKEVHLITDAQAADWKHPPVRLREALADLGSRARFFIVPVEGESPNLAVTDLELVSGVLRQGTTARYQATVRNCGPAAVSGISVRCRVDDVEIDRKTIPLIEPGAYETVSLFVPFHNAGAARITAEVDGDPLAADNVRRTVAVVREKVSVLCVDGSAGDAGRVLTAALLARADGAQDEDHVVRSVPWLSFPAENLAEVDVLILADVPELTPEQVARLERFVREGNGLVWFAGENVKPGAWNERAAGKAGSLLPATLGATIDAGDALGAGKPLDPEMPDHTVCLPLMSLPEDLFNETRFLRQFEAAPHPSSFPVLRLAGSGEPVLIEQSLGRGRVFMFTTSADTTWNNMALTPVFPMVMQQIVTYLSGREFERPRTVGDPLTLAYVEAPDASDAVFDTPSGETITVPVREVGGQFVALLDQADEAGYYTARVSVQAAGLPVAVNVDTRESDVACLPADELRANLEGLGLRVAVGDEELGTAIDTTRTGRSAWRTFMLAALAFLVFESLLADRLLGRKRPRDDSSTPEPDAQHA